ncbi:MAG: exonuclease [Ignavibacteria bacterium RIFOXYB2_FULL_35_12]|nr:MAG: exonuclease [Ignavibacteria bacterium GWA2_36_19]OGU50364.1 MAG: exonuclease [Ignavibacteria bacterium GWC2_35_8]OGU58847.1 MAG: exonuclease [Ignavibacteria bacterium GWF2_35_20]OGU79956.1 MAG: exonuclease [Ignavibacteria bacterium RBG_16_35_7]OGU80921.1 MAG: exonuclease [Ignavibacteria bacterium RIFOXYA2_FULL_35_9]OGU86037.1 MAG: exonuclease [Ignavibacteria bacterium RIFOXYA12_FULL_35_25]OGU91005.1 MAG: exonuclease [Ignavibacteria bacterium RIFOXYC12_FULL_35_11]OGU97161.1 MAG: exonu
MIKFLPLGGADEIGANCYYLNIAGTGIILDCGMHPQKTGLNSLPQFSLIENLPVDYALISHAHQDHLMSLPFLVKKHPYIRIITSRQTRELAELTLHNSVSIMQKELERDNSFQAYTHEEIDLLSQTIDFKPTKDVFEIESFKHKSSEPIKVSFHDAGHILGSVGILIEHNGKNIFYTGDINLTNQTLLKGCELPKQKVDTLILECTYGATDSASILSWTKEAERFAAEANKILNQGGSILIPVFALGKMQEILSTIWKLMERNKLTATDIYTGGIGTKINRLYDANRYLVNMIDTEFQLKSISFKNLNDVENSEEFFKYPCIVVASSGMMIEGTASFKLAKSWLKQKNSGIFIVGYMDESTPGNKIANAVKGGKIKLTEFSQEEIVKCSIEKFRFSAHSKREELIEIVRKLKPKKIILVHGGEDAISWVGNQILKELKGVKVFQAELGKEIEI